MFQRTEIICTKKKRNVHKQQKPLKQRLPNVGAENGTRTRDPNLGKVVLYQLSYFCKISEEEETRTPTSQLTLPPQSSASTNSATSPTLFYLQEPSAFKLLCGKKNIVPRTGLEPARLSTHAPETCASTNSATWAFLRLIAFNVSCLSNK